MAFTHTCKIEVGLCDCGEMIFYRPKSEKQIKDKLYDWVLIGKRWWKLKNSPLMNKYLIETVVFMQLMRVKNELPKFKRAYVQR